MSSRTQVANDLLTVELAERHANTTLEVTCVFPSLVRSDLFRHASGVPRPLPCRWLTSPGASDSHWRSPRLSGRVDVIGREALWQASEALVGNWLPDA